MWMHENCLSIKEDQCACLRVITEASDHLDQPILTESGSIWNNDLQGFGDTIPEDYYKRYRGKCIESEFASLEIVPILCNSRIISLIHLADTRKDMLRKEDMHMLESVAPDIGEVV